MLLLLSIIAKADQIFELIKIPNLTLHKLENKNSLAYLKPTKDFFVGSSFKNVSCKKNQSQNFNKKYLETERGFDRYNDDFFRKIKLKYKFKLFCKFQKRLNLQQLSIQLPMPVN